MCEWYFIFEFFFKIEFKNLKIDVGELNSIF